MESNKRISELLVQTGAYSDLDQPVILTSGELGIYYINTEKLCQDGGEFKKYGDDSKAMIIHAVRMMEEHPTFKEIISILVEKIKSMLPKKFDVVSGGQRRDWLFSGPVANELGTPHLSLYKDGKRELLVQGGETFNDRNFHLRNKRVIHIVDLITEGSSVYRIEKGKHPVLNTEEDKEKGWIPMIRNKGATIDTLVAVVTRLQGGEERLAGLEKPVNVHSEVAIDQGFAAKHSTNPKRAIEYMGDPKAWSENYLRENGALVLVGTFDPNGGKLDKAKKFFDRYGNVLEESGKMLGLEVAVQERYGRPLSEILGGN